MNAAATTPLVSLLVPAYNPRFVAEALASALAQSYSNIEIIIRDDCRSDELREVVSETASKDPRINYAWNRQKQGGLHNYLECMSAARGEYIKFMNDDDILAPDCVERMVCGLATIDGVSLVTSFRRQIDEHGHTLPEIGAFTPLVEQDSVIDGADLANLLLFFRSNRIGEPTATMFRRKDILGIRPHFMCFGAFETPGAGDMALWLNLLAKGNLLYLADPLVSLRKHSAQRQRDPEIRRAVKNSWKKLRRQARRIGLYGHRLPIRFRSRELATDRWRWTYVDLRYLYRGSRSVLRKAFFEKRR
jgi:glycosyltransferase involved in cell wall biosynthesis